MEGEPCLENANINFLPVLFFYFRHFSLLNFYNFSTQFSSSFTPSAEKRLTNSLVCSSQF